MTGVSRSAKHVREGESLIWEEQKKVKVEDLEMFRVGNKTQRDFKSPTKEKDTQLLEYSPNYIFGKLLAFLKMDQSP